MVIPKKITNKMFATKVIDFILDELCYLREKFEHGDESLISRPDEQKYIPFYQCIGKAATLFSVMYKDKVKLTLLQNRRRFSQSARVLDDFVNNFSTSFFQRVEHCPEPWFPVIVLMYCGVFGAIADCCKVANRPDLVEVCMLNLELDMRTLAEDIRETGGWRRFYDTSCIFAALYDTQFWTEDSDEEQAQEERRPAHQAQVPVQYPPEENQARELVQNSPERAHEPAKEEKVQELEQNSPEPAEEEQVQELEQNSPEPTEEEQELVRNSPEREQEPAKEAVKEQELVQNSPEREQEPAKEAVKAQELVQNSPEREQEPAREAVQEQELVQNSPERAQEPAKEEQAEEMVQNSPKRAQEPAEEAGQAQELVQNSPKRAQEPVNKKCKNKHIKFN